MDSGDVPGRSNSLESINGNTMRMTITGNLKEEKSNPANCVVRCCQIRVSEIEFSKDYLRANPSTSFILGFSMNKVRHILKTMPIEFGPVALSTGRSLLDLRVCFHYVHSLKDYDDILRILLIQVPKKKQRHHDAILASASLDMTFVLQCGTHTEDIAMRSMPTETNRLEKGGTSHSDVVATLHATVWSFPEEIETIDDAQEWEMQEVPMTLTDDEELFDSDSNEEEDDVSWNPPSQNSQPITATPNTPTKNASLLSQKLWEQHGLEESNKKMAAHNKKSKLQKLSSLLKPKHKDSDSDAGDDREEDERGEYDLGTDSSSDADSRDVELITSGTTTHLKMSPNMHELVSPDASPPSARREHTQVDYKPLDPGLASPKGKPSAMPEFNPTSLSLGDALPTRILLINGLKRRGRKLEECIARDTGTIRTRFCVITTKKSADVSTVITTIFNKYQQRSDHIRVGIVGSDSYINDVLRPFIEQLAKKPRGWEPLQFYVLPIGKNNNDIAWHIASQDSAYQALFFSPEWQDLFAQTEPTRMFTEDECQEIEARISQYMDRATTPLKLAIGEALLTYPDSTSKSVPFLKGVHIGGERERDAEEAPSENISAHLQLDYWIPKKKGPNEDHHEIKSPFSFAAVTRLPSVASALRVTPDYKPTANTMGFFVLYRDKSKGRMNVLTRHFGSKLKKKDEKEGSRGKKEDKEVSLAAITKLVCSVTNDDNVFRVVIDGVEYPGIKFVSVLPQWATHVKHFPIQVFTVDSDSVPSGLQGGAQNTNGSSLPIPVPTSTPVLTSRVTPPNTSGAPNPVVGASPQTTISPKTTKRDSLEL